MEDKAIIELYFARDQQAIQETDRKYGGYCYSIANRILNSIEDSEETVSDTLWKTWNSIPPHRPGFLKMYLAKITRNLAFSKWRKLSAVKRGGGEMEIVWEELADCIPGKEQVDERLRAKELAKTIRRFLDSLPAREQEIFLRRYFYVDDTQSIAKRLNMKQANVNLILSRTRAKLKVHLIQEGYEL